MRVVLLEGVLADNNEFICAGKSFFLTDEQIKKYVNPNYKKGFDILMEYWDSIDDEQKEDVDKRLKELGL